MERQLALMEPSEADWRLDDHTKQVGRQGVAAAREALRRAVIRATERGRAA